MKKSVLVVGGGLAGIAAATALHEQHYPVTLIERRRTLGGRASAFPTDSGWLDNCQHVILGSCVNLINLLDKLGTRRFVTFYSDIHFLANGKTTTIKPSKLPAPIHFLPNFLKAPLFSMKEKLRILKLFSKLFSIDRNEPSLDCTSLLQWLRGQGQTDRSINNFWNLVFISALNETPDRASAKYGVMVLQETFLRHRDAALFGTPNVSLAELYDEAARNLFKDAEVSLKQSTVTSILLNGEKPSVLLENGEQVSADYLISALPFYNLLPLLSENVRHHSFFEAAENLETSPILGIHLWFDRKVTRFPFGAFCDSPIHWFFAKPSQEKSCYIQLVVSACRPYMSWTTEKLVNLGVGEMRKYLPETEKAVLLKSVVVREARATFSPKPGCDRFRPSQKTPFPGLYLAGDWTDTGWPATMEGAVRSGYRAVELILEEDGTPQAIELAGPR